MASSWGRGLSAWGRGLKPLASKTADLQAGRSCELVDLISGGRGLSPWGEWLGDVGVACQLGGVVSSWGRGLSAWGGVV